MKEMTGKQNEGTACCKAEGLVYLGKNNECTVTCGKCGRDCSKDLIVITISEKEYWNRQVAFANYLAEQNFPLEKLFKD